MKHVLTGCMGCSLLLLMLCGCGPELAQSQLGAEEEQWQTQIRASYPSWRPPRSAPPATFDSKSADYKPMEQSMENQELTVEAKETEGPAEAAPDTVGIPSDNQQPAAAEAAQPVAEPAHPAVAEEQKPAAEGETYTVQKGDSISKIAQKFYGDGRKFMPIIKANEAVLKGNPNRIYPGMKLSIPKL